MAAVDFLSRFGRPDIAAENELVRTAAMLTLEDRARLAEVLARRKQIAARAQLMRPTWALVQRRGPPRVDSRFGARRRSTSRRTFGPIARLLTATLAVDPETCAHRPAGGDAGRRRRALAPRWIWNTQDYALGDLGARRVRSRSPRAAGARRSRQRSATTACSRAGGGARFVGRAHGPARRCDDGRTLRASLERRAGRWRRLLLSRGARDSVGAAGDAGRQGHQVERWYERYETGTPVTTVAEGDLVRVRLRITVPSARQFVVLDDALPAGLEAIDLSLRTARRCRGLVPRCRERKRITKSRTTRRARSGATAIGIRAGGRRSIIARLRDDRVVYSATILWPGRTRRPISRARRRPGTFLKPPAHAEEMYNPGVNGRSDGGTFVVTPRSGGK